ncbi:hypothetical protein RSOLAG22IIIB_11273 [Rhizoctonia solani]|uniref:ABM domain-containing protein n=1 Tax=Rhizoctonia solani TaxID=456999 RepID=A0A0K6G7C8_9AGAM|nr:hypothetical protein RSOLAG22IIIB_11273 [Rhizoctonia solani]
MVTGLSLDGFNEKIIILAQFMAQDSQADNLASIFKQMRDHSVSAADPGCLTHRLSRNGNDFVVFEEFKDAASVAAHNEDPKHKAWLAQLKEGNFLVSLPQIKAYEEIQE